MATEEKETGIVLDNDGKLTEGSKTYIKERAASLRKEKGTKGKIFPVVVYGDSTDSKPVYVSYFAQPNVMAFSKFMALSKSNEIQALWQLAKEIFVEGDQEMVHDEALFLYGTMGQLNNVLSTRQGEVINL